MIFHENHLLADGSHVHCKIKPYFCPKLGKVAQNLSAAVVIGALRVNTV